MPCTSEDHALALKTSLEPDADPAHGAVMEIARGEQIAVRPGRDGKDIGRHLVLEGVACRHR